MIWIVGQHSSGSSCLATVLHKLGVCMYDRQAFGAHSNKGGSGEDSRVAKWCERCYRFPSSVMIGDSGKAIQELHDIVSTTEAAGFKYPTLSLLRPEILTVDPDPIVVRSYRPLEESIVSLQLRVPKRAEQAERLQKAIWHELEHEWPRTTNYYEVHYHALLDDTEAEVHGLVDFLGLQPTEQQLQAAVQHPKQQHRHVKHEEQPTLTTNRRKNVWAYGVTTCDQRIDNGYLETTLKSLAAAGFDEPRLFVDSSDGLPITLFNNYPTTWHSPPLRTFGNWFAALWELYVRNPGATRYAIFQDDFVTYPHLRDYLDSCEYPDHGYWNLYTFPANQQLARGTKGWYLSNQYGRGAVGLIFDLEAVTTLLASEHMIMRPQDCHRGWRAVDGAIVTAMAKAGYKEYVHNPSLTQHIGEISSIKNRPHKKANSFMGENFDARQLIC